MKEYLERSMSFAAYEKLIDELLAEGRTTGANQSEALLGNARLNRQRMRRLEKTVLITESLVKAARELDRSMIWLVITEGWCGDAAQNLPVIEKIAAESDKIKTRYILRDENPELIDRFLTAGARSIPKLIALDAETLEIVGTWGARPAAAQAMFAKMKKDGAEKAVIMEELQRWYNSDRGRTLQLEFERLLAEWSGRPVAVAARLTAA